MKSILLVTIVASFFCSTVSLAQVRTEESRVTVDSVKGDTTYSKSVIVSESGDITPRHSMIVINPLKFFIFYNLSYFQKVSATTAVGGGVRFPTLSGLDGFGLSA